MALEEYKKKRDFRVTPEPEGGAASRGGSSFVIQKHAASRLHYDFRLELDGVLKSWAIPKGPSLDPGEKRLAVHVEDHPLDYGGFEGIIPKGQYGGGTVLLWDRGTWTPEGDPREAYRKGKLKFLLEGEKLHGIWNLVRMGGAKAREKSEWLLIKEKDPTARPGSGDAVVEEHPQSVASGRTLAEIADDPERVWHSNREEPKGGATTFKEKIAKAEARSLKRRPPEAAAAAAGGPEVPGAKKARIPERIAPQLATLVGEPPRGEQWLHELKYDGYRVLIHLDGGRARIVTRNGKDWTDRFAPIARAAEALRARQAVLDGEVVVLEPDGTTSFQALQNALSGDRQRDLTFFAFDLLYQDGYDLRGAKLVDRKEALSVLLEGGPPALRFSDHVEGAGEEFYRQACGFALEGIVSKRRDLPYHSGRNKDWLKVKCLERQELVVVGWTDPEGSRTGFGSLLLAVHDDQGRLTYAGKVGTGFTDALLAELRERLGAIERKSPAFDNPPRGAEARRSHWVEPELVAEVAFTEWTRDGVLRHPTFQALREDKPPEEVVRERPGELPPEAEGGGKEEKVTPAKAAKKAKPKPEARGKAAAGPKTQKPALKPAPTEPPPAKPEKEALVAGVRMSSPDKVLYPSMELTKRDLATYYDRIQAWILPYLKDRPLTLVRCPQGAQKKCFYQKHVSDQFPETVRRVEVQESGDGAGEPYGAVASIEGLVSMVQMGVLELHVWGSRWQKLEKPDYVVFDLDPDEGLPWERVVEAAYETRELLSNLGLESFLKTTGGKGLHVVLPIRPGLEWDDVKAFTKAVSERMVANAPKRYTAKLPKASRKGKVFIDYLRNGRGATSIVAYSTRAKSGAPVSTPLAWEELEEGVRADTFNVRNLPERLESLDADPWAGFFEVRQSITKAMRAAVGAG